MGRVQVRKKTKQINLYSLDNIKTGRKKKRNAGGRDLPPSKDKSDTGPVTPKKSKKRKRNDPSAEKGVAVKRSNVKSNENKEVGNLKENKDGDNKAKYKIEPRQPWESLRQFNRRLQQETQRALLEESKKLKSTSKKRKEYLKEKKLKKKQRTHVDGQQTDDEYSSGDNEKAWRTRAEEDQPVFGEVADRPPSLPKLKLVEKINRKKLIGKDEKEREKMEAEKKKLKARKYGTLSASEAGGQMNQMELMRQRVIEAYRKSNKSKHVSGCGIARGIL